MPLKINLLLANFLTQSGFFYNFLTRSMGGAKISLILILLVCLFSKSELTQAENLLKSETRAYSSLCNTQGLIIEKNKVWQTCSDNDESRLIHWNLTNGEVINQRIFSKVKVRGVTLLKDELYVLTESSGAILKINPQTLETNASLEFTGIGWGLTSDGKNLILSDGSDMLQFISPDSSETVKTSRIRMVDASIYNINELEYINDNIWATIYQTDFIAVIDPKNGLVTKRYYLPALLKEAKNTVGPKAIAYDTVKNKVWITDKKGVLLIELPIYNVNSKTTN
jgi:glutamine cyclotransferase